MLLKYFVYNCVLYSREIEVSVAVVEEQGGADTGDNVEMHRPDSSRWEEICTEEDT